MLSLKPRLARWLLWTSIAVHVPIAVVATIHARLPDYDFDNFYNIATRPGRPYLDFPVEFPVGTVQVFRTVGSIAGGRGNFGVSLDACSRAGLVGFGQVDRNSIRC